MIYSIGELIEKLQDAARMMGDDMDILVIARTEKGIDCDGDANIESVHYDADCDCFVLSVEV